MVTLIMRCSLYKASFEVPIAALIALNTACTTTGVSDVDGRDTVVFTSIEASFPLDEKQNPLRIKINRTEANDGGFTQHLMQGETINLHGSSFYGSDTLNGSFDVSMTAVSLGVEQPLGIDTILGLYGGFANVDLTLNLTSFVNSVDFQEGFSSPYFDVFWQKNHSSRFYTRAGLSIATGLSETSNSFSALNIGIGYKLYKNMHLMTGFRSLNYDRVGSETDSGVLIFMNGPYFSLNFAL